MATTITPSGLQTIKDEPSQEEINCKAEGGKWDKENSVCIMPKKEVSKTLPPRPEGSEPAYTGKQDGVYTREGKSFIVPEKEAQALASKNKTLEFQAGQERDQAIADQQIFAAQQANIDLQRQQLIEGETPQQHQLNPDATFQETIPIWGSLVRSGKLIGTKIKETFGITPSQQLTPEDYKRLGLSEIQQKEIEKGLTWSEAVGSLVEAAPFGGKISSVADIETPRGNLEEVFKDIKSMRKRIMNIETNVKMGYLPVSVAQDQIKDIENYINEKEARLQNLIIHSPSLNFNSDRVNSFETDILIVREKLFQSKLNVLTGQEQDPSDLDMFLKMQEQDSPEWSAEEW